MRRHGSKVQLVEGWTCGSMSYPPYLEVGKDTSCTTGEDFRNRLHIEMEGFPSVTSYPFSFVTSPCDGSSCVRMVAGGRSSEALIWKELCSVILKLDTDPKTAVGGIVREPKVSVFHALPSATR
jgi:hypothetical protein